MRSRLLTVALVPFVPGLVTAVGIARQIPEMSFALTGDSITVRDRIGYVEMARGGTQ
jgi:hypothetical protein